MKKLLTLTYLLASLLVCMNSCGNDEPDGLWEPMKWSKPAPEGLVETRSHVYQVPNSGGDYTITCLNYGSPWMTSALAGDTTYFPEGKSFGIFDENQVYSIRVTWQDETQDWHRLHGYWFDARFEKANLKIHFDALPDTVELRKLDLSVTAGDIFDYFFFIQGEKNR